jgi:hypothetical protein
MVSMMKVRKDLPKFVMLERAAAIISLSWIRGQAFIQIFRHCFRDFLTLLPAFVQGRSADVSGIPERAIVVVMN